MARSHRVASLNLLSGHPEHPDSSVRALAPVPEFATVTPSPTIDISAVVERIVPFSKLRCESARYDPGGGGINVARVLKRFGGNPRAVIPVGGPQGELLRRLLKQEDLSAVMVRITADTRQDFTVFERESGDQYRFVFPASPISRSEATSVFDALSDIAPVPAYLVVSGSCPENVAAGFFDDAARAARKASAKLVVDTSGSALSAAIQHAPYLIKPNLREFETLAGCILPTDDLRLRAARDLLAGGRVELIALTLGADGALLISRNGAWRGVAPKIQPLSTVGAGDSFLGAFVWQLGKAAPLSEALRFAIAAGSAALLAPGTELCRPEDIERLLPLVRVHEV